MFCNKMKGKEETTIQTNEKINCVAGGKEEGIKLNPVKNTHQTHFCSISIFFFVRNLIKSGVSPANST